jgi:hypothetical protein
MPHVKIGNKTTPPSKNKGTKALAGINPKNIPI